MTWTYGNTPGMDTAVTRRDGVRFLVGDTDQEDQQVTDEEIVFALSQAQDDIYSAGSIIAGALSAKYARLVDTAVDDAALLMKFSQSSKTYAELATRLEKQSVKGIGASSNLGLPYAGGISISDVKSAEENIDRVAPVFTVTEPYDGFTEE